VGMKPIAMIVSACLFLQTLPGAVRGDRAAYLGGTAPIPKDTQGTVDFSDAEQFRFEYSGRSFSIPYARITTMEFGQKAGRRVGITMAAAVTVLGLMALPILLSRKKNHFLTLGFESGENTNGAIVLEW